MASKKPVKQPTVTPALVEAHGLKPDEYERIRALISRTPSFTELGIFSAMWNEHCSYKSSKIHLRTLPTKAPWVIQGPGENAGVIVYRGWARLCVQDGKPQPPEPTSSPIRARRPASAASCAMSLPWGRGPIACLNALSFGAPMPPQDAPYRFGQSSPASGWLWQFLRRADRQAARCASTPAMTAIAIVNAMAVGNRGDR